MYADYFGLKELPFELTSDSRFFCLTAAHREAWSVLSYGMTARKSISLLVGGPGTGKTMVLTSVIERLGDSVSVVRLASPSITPAEFGDFLVSRFGLSSQAGSSASIRWDELENALRLRCERSSQVCVLAIDEAQALSDAVLEDLRMLTNLEVNGRRLLPVVLVGQPELERRLAEPRWTALKQRVALRSTLPPLDLPDVAAYIAARILSAGGDPAALFTREAVSLIAQYSGGVPRTIGVVCDNALLAAFGFGRRPVTLDVVRAVCSDFGLCSADTRGRDARFTERTAASVDDPGPTAHAPSPAPVRSSRSRRHPLSILDTGSAA